MDKSEPHFYVREKSVHVDVAEHSQLLGELWGKCLVAVVREVSQGIGHRQLPEKERERG